MKRPAVVALACALHAAAVGQAAAYNDRQFLGEVRAFAFNFCPEGWLVADGQLLKIAQYTALFSLLGTSYGGDGKSTFAVPDLSSDNHLRYCIALDGMYPPRAR